ncbi:MAG TPA: ferritin family protein [Atribacteraceae bacterium]|nr:ferritin family protein [Atribacteraceae bacterium]
MSIQEILQQALKLEEDGRIFYLEGLNRVSNELSKETLARLADEELIHMEKIREGYQRIEKGEAFSWEGTGGIRKSSREHFDNIFTEARKKMEELVPPFSEEIDVLKTAMDLESQAHHFYLEQAKTISNNKMKDFLDFLATEEYRHYNLLFNTLEYITSPTEWHYREERPIFEGG